MKKFSLIIIALFLFLTSCSSSKNSTNVASNQQKLERQYQIYKGTKYKYGGTDKRGFDCSGFTQKVYNDAFNIRLPRTTEAMAKIGKKVPKNKLSPGDLVFFKPSRKYNHVGIFLGDGLFMHSSTSKGVIQSNLNEGYWKKKYQYAKRILNTK